MNYRDKCPSLLALNIPNYQEDNLQRFAGHLAYGISDRNDAKNKSTNKYSSGKYEISLCFIQQ